MKFLKNALKFKAKTFRKSLRAFIFVGLVIGSGFLLLNPFLLKEAVETVKSTVEAATVERQAMLAQKIFKDIIKVLPLDMRSNLHLIVANTSMVNAYAMSDGTIVVFTGLIDEMKENSGALAAVLGHEIAHVVLKHHYGEDLSDVQKEYFADIVGVTYALTAGYAGCNVIDFWSNQTKGYDDYLETSSHPTKASRVVYLLQFCTQIGDKQ